MFANGLIFIYIYIIGLRSRVFASGPGDRGSIPGRVIPKTQKWYLMPPCLILIIIRYGSRVKWSNTGTGVVSSPKLLSKKEAFGSPSTKIANFLLTYMIFLYKYWLQRTWVKNTVHGVEGRTDSLVKNDSG